METNKTFEEMIQHCKANYKRRKTGFGIFAIILGGLLLFNQIYPNSINFHYVWPSLLILVGIKSIIKARYIQKHGCC